MKKLCTFASAILTSFFLTQAASAGDETDIKFNYKSGVNVVDVGELSYIRNSVVFSNNHNGIEHFSLNRDDKSFTLTIKTKNLDSDPDNLDNEENPLMMAFMNRYKDGAYGYMFPFAKGNVEGYAPQKAVYFFDTALYINYSRVKGEFSVLVSGEKKGDIYKTHGVTTAFYNNNPYGRYLETEDGNCYSMGTNTNHDINIYKTDCGSVKS